MFHLKTFNMHKLKTVLIISLFVLFAVLNLNTILNSNNYNNKTVAFKSAIAGGLYQNYELNENNPNCKICEPKADMSCDVSWQCCDTYGIPCNEPE
jgi:hypothetical protein